MLSFLSFLRVLKYHNEIISIGFVVGADIVLHLLLRRLNFFFVDVSVLLLVCFFFIAFLLSFLSLRGEQSLFTWEIENREKKRREILKNS